MPVSDGLVDKIGEVCKQSADGQQLIQESKQEQQFGSSEVEQQSQPSKPLRRSCKGGGPGKIDNVNKQLTSEERKHNASLAGQASGAVRQERGFVRKALLAKLTPEVLDQMLSAVLGQAIKKGDIAAYKAVLDTIGESNVQALQIDFGSDTRAAIANMTMQDKLALIQAAQEQSKGKGK